MGDSIDLTKKPFGDGTWRTFWANAVIVGGFVVIVAAGSLVVGGLYFYFFK